jgi:hypothetical protein
VVSPNLVASKYSPARGIRHATTGQATLTGTTVNRARAEIGHSEDALSAAAVSGQERTEDRPISLAEDDRKPGTHKPRRHNERTRTVQHARAGDSADQQDKALEAALSTIERLIPHANRKSMTRKQRKLRARTDTEQRVNMVGRRR